MAVIALVAVKVKPFTVAACPAANALNTTVSVDFEVEVEPTTKVDTGVADAEPEVVTIVGSADTASMAVPLIFRPETAAVEVDVAATASVPIVKSRVKLLPAFNAVVLAAKAVEIVRCALAIEVIDTA